MTGFVALNVLSGLVTCASAPSHHLNLVRSPSSTGRSQDTTDQVDAFGLQRSDDAVEQQNHDRAADQTRGNAVEIPIREEKGSEKGSEIDDVALVFRGRAVERSKLVSNAYARLKKQLALIDSLPVAEEGFAVGEGQEGGKEVGPTRIASFEMCANCREGYGSDDSEKDC